MNRGAGALPERATTLLIGALGGEGGGLLADWVVGAAIAAGFPVQSTSIPGVAQRTGATTYYLEVFPAPLEALGGRDPVMSLYPSPGDVDVVVSSELLEAGRSIENGFVSPDRTTLIASTHRIYAIAEKSAMGDGIHDGARILEAAREMARRPILHDLAAIAAERDVALNAVFLGIIAGAEALPIPEPAYEAAIRARGVAAEPNLAGFAVGLGVARGEVEAPATAATPPRSWSGAAPAAGLEARVREGFPAEVRDMVEEGTRRLTDYQDAAYAARYMAKNVVAAELAERCTIQLSYAIGVAKPLSLYVDTHDTGQVDEAKLASALSEAMDLTPHGIRKHLQLNKPIYARTATYGHFGREPEADGGFSWERTDLAEELKRALV